MSTPWLATGPGRFAKLAGGWLLVAAGVWAGGAMGLALGALGAALLTSLQAPAAPFTPAPAPVAPLPPAEPQSGTRLMAQAVVPVWRNQMDATMVTGETGMATLMVGTTAIADALWTMSEQLEKAAADTGPDASPAQAAQATQWQTDALMLRDLLDQLLTHCQYGDRQTQMIQILATDMDRFTAELPGFATATEDDANQWLARLENSYTTDEQRAQHKGEAVVASSCTVDFF
ncbi:MAG: hypothetical protein CFE46_08650 [Burkholderiales bacterium PBB6]|nr:MAG: hypothetical protein CFE46_08650 [Burkholderiales bacterium PBB6]